MKKRKTRIYLFSLFILVILFLSNCNSDNHKKLQSRYVSNDYSGYNTNQKMIIEDIIKEGKSFVYFDTIINNEIYFFDVRLLGVDKSNYYKIYSEEDYEKYISEMNGVLVPFLDLNKKYIAYFVAQYNGTKFYFQKPKYKLYEHKDELHKIIPQTRIEELK